MTEWRTWPVDSSLQCNDRVDGHLIRVEVGPLDFVLVGHTLVLAKIHD